MLGREGLGLRGRLVLVVTIALIPAVVTAAGAVLTARQAAVEPGAAQPNHEATISLALVTGSTIVAGLLAWIAGDVFVLRRMRALASVTERLAAGDLSARTDLPREHGELGALAHAFEQVARSLEESEHARLRAEDGLFRAQQTLKLLYACSRALSDAGGEAALLESACRIIVETGGYYMAQVDLRQGDGLHSSEVASFPAYGTDFPELTRLRNTAAELGDDPITRAISTGEVQVAPLGCRGTAARPQNRWQIIAVPVLVGERSLGALTVGCRGSGEPDAEQIALLSAVAAIIAVNLAWLRARKQNERVARAERRRREPVEGSTRAGQPLTVVVDTDGRVVHPGPATGQIPRSRLQELAAPPDPACTTPMQAAASSSDERGQRTTQTPRGMLPLPDGEEGGVDGV